jgi:hypothetical protein
MATTKNTSTTGHPSFDASRLGAIVRDAAYVVVGFGVLTVQQLQVQRRELADRLSNHNTVQQLGITRTQIDELIASLEARLTTLDERLVSLEGRIDTAVDTAVERLPEQAGALVEQAHEIAKAARKQMRGLIRTAA